MKLPEKDGLEKLVILTSNLVWSDKLTREDLRAWLDNFEGKVHKKSYEQHLALWLLANFVYYNQQEVQHLCRLLYREFLHKRLISGGDPTLSVEENLRKFRIDTRFHYLGRPSESGGFILYYFRKENALSTLDFVGSSFEVGPEVENIVLVDDVTLSGKAGQAKKYLREIERHFSGKKIYVLTLIASTEAVEHLSDHGITAITGVVLDEQHRCFGQNSDVFFQHKEHRDDCRAMASFYGDRVAPGMPLGYNDCQYLFGFFYNTPDNSLPILWADTNGWTPIVKRYHKSYRITELPHVNRFV
ncbi:MAG: hypothetical protein AAF756_21635 [Pseudomonadota bacterium]